MSDILYVVLFVILVVIIVILIMYNKLVRLYNKVKKSKSNIEIYLNKRFDLIPNLVECVKGYSKYEDETLEKIVSLRSDYDNTKGLKLNDLNSLDHRLSRYLAVVENYPDLKANTEYLSLQTELSRIEDQLEIARTRYNDEATEYNTAIESVPSNIIALIFAFKKFDLFSVEEEKRENVKVNL